MRFKILSFAALLTIPFVAFAAGPWPNEPEGSHQFLDCPFNSLGGCNMTGGGFAIVPDATAPVSPSNVAKSTLAAGANTGGSEVYYNTPQYSKELYVGVMWRTNPQFQGRNVGNKLFFVRGPSLNGVFNMDGPSGGPWTMNFHHNSGNLNNSHACGGDAIGSTCSPNVGSGSLTVGAWTKLEVYIKASTTTTSRDGIVKWWVNGQPAGSYTNLNYGPQLSTWVWAETWDACGGNANCDLGRINTVEWNHYVDHLYLSAPNFVLSVPKIINDTIPSLAQTGQSYSAYLKLSGGYTPYTWTISSGSLPGGLTLGEKTGVISGKPSTCGSHNFTVKVTDANGSFATKSFSINVGGTCTSGMEDGRESRVSSREQENGMRIENRAGSVRFHMPRQDKYQLTIYDLSGKEVYAGSGAGQGEIRINATFGNGVYVAKMKQGPRTSTARFNAMN